MSGIPIGRLFGINLRVHWSWSIIALLIASSFALGALPTWHPSWSVATNWTVGIAAAVALFTSILLHELAHSVMANRLGTEVDHITFFIFGGVSNLHHEPSSPRAEFLITVVGPLTSLLIGITMLGTAMGATGTATPALEHQSPIITTILWIGQINIILAIFNCMPGFPLDGGRLLRAAIWSRTGDLTKATRVAAGAGRVVAWGLIMAGTLMIVGVHLPWFGTGVGGIWLIGIGYFLMIANMRSEQAQVLESRLTEVPVTSIMREPRVLNVDVSVQAFVDTVLHGGEHAYGVTDGPRIAGIACAHDAARMPQESWEMRTMRSIMTPADRMATVEPTDTLATALDVFQDRRVNELAVIDGEQMVGILEMRDLATWIQLTGDGSSHA